MELNKETIAIMATVILAAALAVSGFFIVKSIKDGRTVLTDQADYQLPRDAQLHQEKERFHKLGIGKPPADFFIEVEEGLQEKNTELGEESLVMETDTEEEVANIEEQETSQPSTWEPEEVSSERSSSNVSEPAATPSSSSSSQEDEEDTTESAKKNENKQVNEEESKKGQENPAQDEESKEEKDQNEETGEGETTEKEKESNSGDNEDQKNTSPPEDEAPSPQEGEEEPPAEEDPVGNDGGSEN